MALGYALIGTALLAGGPGASAGRHLLAGAIKLSIYAVTLHRWRAHCGHPADERPRAGGAHRPGLCQRYSLCAGGCYRFC